MKWKDGTCLVLTMLTCLQMDESENADETTPPETDVVSVSDAPADDNPGDDGEPPEIHADDEEEPPKIPSDEDGEPPKILADDGGEPPEFNADKEEESFKILGDNDDGEPPDGDDEGEPPKIPWDGEGEPPEGLGDVTSAKEQEELLVDFGKVPTTKEKSEFEDSLYPVSVADYSQISDETSKLLHRLHYDPYDEDEVCTCFVFVTTNA